MARRNLGKLTTNIVTKTAQAGSVMAKQGMSTFCSEETIEALGFIQQVLNQLKEFRSGRFEHRGNFDPFILGIIYMVHRRHLTPQLESLGTPKSMSEDERSDLQQIGKFAFGVYPSVSTWESLGVAEEDLVLVALHDVVEYATETYHPRFALFLHHKTNSLVLSIRGTMNPKDVVVDLMCNEVAFLGGWSHTGMVRSAKIVIDNAGPIIFDTLGKYPDYQLLLTGHSLGGGVANVIALQVLEGDLSSIVPPGTSMKCVTFAAPPVLFHNNPEIFKRAKETMTNYVNNADVVPRLSLANVAQLHIQVYEVQALGLSMSTKMALMAGKKDKDTENAFQQVLKIVEDTDSVEQEFKRLEHPGKLVYLRGWNTGQGLLDLGKPRRMYEEWQEEAHFSKRIVLLDTMVADHFFTSYTDALKNVL